MIIALGDDPLEVICSSLGQVLLKCSKIQIRQPQTSSGATLFSFFSVRYEWMTGHTCGT